MVYLASGKYLEPSDHRNTGKLNRIYGLWDKDPFRDPNLRLNFRLSGMLKQTILSETSVTYDADGDGTKESTALVRKSTQNDIDWETHFGWYMDLEYPEAMGEQVITKPLLRDGKLVVSTHIPVGNECSPTQTGWLMILDAVSGAMLPPSIDLNNDGSFNQDEILSGIQGLSNPLAAPTIVSSQAEDIILTGNADGSGSSSTTLNSNSQNGRISWRELEP